MTDLAQRERQALLDLLEELGPDAPTCCEGWTTLDLAAHLAVRERRLDAAVGLVAKGLGGHTERVRLRYREKGLSTLVGMLRQQPRWSPLSTTSLDRMVNTVEYFVHHEDVRRAQPQWEPRSLPRADNEELWRKSSMAKLLLRRTGLTVTLSSPAYGRRTIGRGPVDATVSGKPGEIVLFCSGRQDVAKVEVTGPQAERLRQTDLNL
ncbi:MAG TPA: TIGR03085 family protein [Candidatus Stackebrandtia excrementipullorum]|nr:TIGR03085 family protein [Candidatus Stackebrandtia excrementipullorum]